MGKAKIEFDALIAKKREELDSLKRNIEENKKHLDEMDQVQRDITNQRAIRSDEVDASDVRATTNISLINDRLQSTRAMEIEALKSKNIRIQDQNKSAPETISNEDLENKIKIIAVLSQVEFFIHQSLMGIHGKDNKPTYFNALVSKITKDKNIDNNLKYVANLLKYDDVKRFTGDLYASPIDLEKGLLIKVNTTLRDTEHENYTQHKAVIQDVNSNLQKQVDALEPALKTMENIQLLLSQIEQYSITKLIPGIEDNAMKQFIEDQKSRCFNEDGKVDINKLDEIEDYLSKTLKSVQNNDEVMLIKKKYDDLMTESKDPTNVGMETKAKNIIKALSNLPLGERHNVISIDRINDVQRQLASHRLFGFGFKEESGKFVNPADSYKQLKDEAAHKAEYQKINAESKYMILNLTKAPGTYENINTLLTQINQYSLTKFIGPKVKDKAMEEFTAEIKSYDKANLSQKRLDEIKNELITKLSTVLKTDEVMLVKEKYDSLMRKSKDLTSIRMEAKAIRIVEALSELPLDKRESVVSDPQNAVQSALASERIPFGSGDAKSFKELKEKAKSLQESANKKQDENESGGPALT